MHTYNFESMFELFHCRIITIADEAVVIMLSPTTKAQNMSYRPECPCGIRLVILNAYCM